MFKCISNSTQS